MQLTAEVYEGLGAARHTCDGPLLIEFFDRFDELQAVGRTMVSVPGGVQMLYRNDKQFMAKMVQWDYGIKLFVDPPRPRGMPGRIRLRRLHGAELCTTHAATDIVIRSYGEIIGLFFRILSDDVWGWVTATDPDWAVTLVRQGIDLRAAGYTA